MNLQKLLRKHGYDLIDGPVRNHKLLQLWLKKDSDPVQLYFDSLDDAFIGATIPDRLSSPALKVSASDTDEYNFNIGITILEDLLKSIGLGEIGLSTKIKTGKKVTISYGDSTTEEIPIGELESYLAKADFSSPNPVLLRNAKRNHILLITGVVMSKNLSVKIETDINIDAALMASLKSAAEGKAGFTSSGNHIIDMQAPTDNPFPFAVQASRIRFRDNEFNGLRLVTDNVIDLF